MLVSSSQCQQKGFESEDEKMEEAIRLLRNVRARVQEGMDGISREEAYRMAGFGENAIKDIIRYEDDVAANE